MAKTVFVLGAGASNEVGLPVGGGLKNAIADLLKQSASDGGSGLSEKLQTTILFAEHKGCLGYNQLRPAMLQISAAMPLAISIDNFIDQRKSEPAIEMCAKLAIALTILEAEGASELALGRSRHDSIDFSSVEPTWFNGVFKLLCEGCRAEDLQDRFSQVAFVVFNYDRCLEHFLFHALQTLYGLAANQAAALVNTIEIYHPYGKVGSFNWMQRDPDANIGFGVEAPNPVVVFNVSRQIKTFTEGTDPTSSEIMAIRQVMRQASRVVYLGFAFHRMNLALLYGDGNAVSSAKCYGTVFGVSPSDSNVIEDELVRLGKYQDTLQMHDRKCADFINSFSKSLAFNS